MLLSKNKESTSALDLSTKGKEGEIIILVTYKRDLKRTQ